MRQTKGVSTTPKKSAAKRTRKVAAKKGATPKRSPRAGKKPESPAAAGKNETGTEPAISEARSEVVASKFAGPGSGRGKARRRPALPISYGESHLLLLARDPQTLFAAWDMAPSAVDAVKSRIGSRGFAVSTLTLRLSGAFGGTSLVHLGKKARSRYLKIEGGPSFIAEIGFTTPAGRFELVARSAPCFVPMDPSARAELLETGRRSVLGYREARAMARRGLMSSPQASAAARARARPGKEGATSSAGLFASPGLGGASDLYRR